MKYKLRCSSLDRLLDCSHFVTYDLPKYKTPDNEKATIGTAIHEKAYKGVVDDDTRFYLEYIKDSIKEKSFSYENDIFSLSGTCDAYRFNGDALEVIDLKTGEWDVYPTSLQIVGYAFLVAKTHNWKGNIIGCISQHDDIRSLDITMLVDGFENLIIELLSDTKPKMGGGCIFCPSLLVCTEVENLIDGVLTGDGSMKIEHLKNYKVIEKYIKTLKETFIINYPDRVEYSYRKTKTWREKPNDIKYMEVVSPSKAIKLGYKGDGIDNTHTKIIKGFDLKDL